MSCDSGIFLPPLVKWNLIGLSNSICLTLSCFFEYFQLHPIPFTLLYLRVLLEIEAFVLYKESTSRCSKTTWSKKRSKAARMQALSDRRWRVGVQQEESSMVPLLPTTPEQIGNKYCHYSLTINMLLCYHLFTLKMYH